MERRFGVRRIRLDVAEVGCFPPPFHEVMRRVERETVDMQMWIGNASHRSRREMHELRPREISRDAVRLRTLLPDPRGRSHFNVRHRLRDRVPERFDDFRVARQRVQNGETFRRVKVQVVADHALSVRPGGQPFAGSRMPVFHQRRERFRRHVADQSQESGGLAMPLADDLLLLRIVVLAMQPFRVILAGCRRGLV